MRFFFPGKIDANQSMPYGNATWNGPCKGKNQYTLPGWCIHWKKSPSNEALLS
jgi:hypothetical protein